MRCSLRVAGLLAVVAVTGCGGGDSTPTQVLVRIGAEPCVAARAQSVHVRILDDEGEEARTFMEPLTGRPGEASLPLTIPIVPRGGDASRQFWVDVSIFGDDDAPLGDVRVQGSYLEGRVGEITACLTEACQGVNCGACDPVGPDGGDGTCATCAGDPPTCVSAESVPVPLGTAGPPCGSVGPSCGDGGVTDAGTPDASSDECAVDGDCDDGVDCTADSCNDGTCDNVPADADGDGHVAEGCLDGDDCDDGNPDIHPGASDACHNGVDEDCDGNDPCCPAEDCDNGEDDDCDSFTDCWDDDCGRMGVCQGRRCNPANDRYRWCSGECVNTFTDDHCGSCAMYCPRTSCTTNTSTGVTDGYPRCYCTDPTDCPHGVNCNTVRNRCGCNATSCGAGARCAGAAEHDQPVARCEWDAP